MKITVIVIVIGVLIHSPFAAFGAASARQNSFVAAAQVNGTWSRKRGIIRVWALGNQRLCVEF